MINAILIGFMLMTPLLLVQHLLTLELFQTVPSRSLITVEPKEQNLR